MQPPARQENLHPELARWLVGPGREVITSLVVDRAQGPADELATTDALRRRGLSMEQAGAVAAAASARRRLGPLLSATGWPAGAEVILSATAAEQASHPAVAWHRAHRFPPDARVVDLGCGAGIDAIAISRRAGAVRGVDADEARIILAEHNAKAAGADLTVETARIEHVEIGDADHWHADPGRRTNGRRARTLAETEPPTPVVLTAVAALDGGGLVMSPGVALDDPDLPDGEVEFVQVGHDLVEAVLWCGDLRLPDATAVATQLEVTSDAILVRQVRRSGPAPTVAVGPLGGWLLDPEPASARARVHHQLILEAKGHRISEHRALCTADVNPGDSWWRAWQVEAELPGRPRAVRSWLAGRESLPISIELHGSSDSVDRWWAGLGRHDRGPIGRRIHVVQDGPRARAIVTRHASLSLPGNGR